MALQQILQALDAATAAQTAALQQDAAAQIEAIQAQARVDAAAAYEQQLALIRGPLVREQARILNRAKLKALQISLAAREEQLHAALAAAAEALATVSASNDYPALLRQLTHEAFDAIAADEPYQITVRSSDVALMERIVQQLEITATVEVALDAVGPNADPQQCPLGGLVVTAQNGRIRLDNTLRARLERVATRYRSEIAALLFGPNEREPCLETII